MDIKRITLLATMLLAVLTAACGGEEAPEPEGVLDGPALVLFYADN